MPWEHYVHVNNPLSLYRLNKKDGTEGEQIMDVLGNLLETDPGAMASLQLTCEEELQIVSFETSTMARLFTAYPEVLMIDGTYRVNNNRLVLSVEVYSYIAVRYRHHRTRGPLHKDPLAKGSIENILEI